MYEGRAIIGLTGGIGSGKSFVGGLFGELGCAVIESDALVRAAYDDPQVKDTVRLWWGPDVFTADGRVDRKALAGKVFAVPEDRTRLEGLLHPRVAAARQAAMAAAAKSAQVVAFVWDTPLLFETGIGAQCDATVFVDAPEDLRIRRVQAMRGWTAQDLRTREKAQWPLEKKRSLSDHVIQNTADAEFARGQVRETLARILDNNRKGRVRTAGR